MNYPLPYMLAVIFVSSVALDIYILSLKPKYKIYWIFFITVLVNAMFAFITMMGFISEDRETFTFWYRLRGITMLSTPLGLHTLMEILGVRKRIKIPVLLLFYGSTVFFIFPFINQQLIFRDFTRVEGVWIMVRAERSVLSRSYFFYMSSLWTLEFALSLQVFSTAKLQRLKKQLIVILAASFIYCICITIEFVFLRVISDKNLGLHPVYSFIRLLGLAIAIFKYKFLAITPELVSKDVIENINEFIILLDRNLKVVFINPEARKVFRNPEKAKIEKAIAEYSSIAGVLKSIINGSEFPFNSILNFIMHDGSKCLRSVKFLGIRDKFRDITGIMLVARDIQSIEKIQNKYKLTEREMEIIASLITGMTNNDIAKKLLITRSTIKSHIEHIYNKTSVNNKMELLNLLTEYGIVF